DQVARLQPLVGRGEVGDVHLDVVTVVRRQLAPGLGGVQLLVAADGHRGAALLRGRRRAHHVRIEARDAVRRAGWNVEVDVDDAELDRAVLRGRRVAAHARAPGIGRLDAVLLYRVGEVPRVADDALHLLAGILQAL